MKISAYKVTTSATFTKFAPSVFSMQKLDTEGALLSFSNAIIAGNLSCANLRGGKIMRPYTLTYNRFDTTTLNTRGWIVVPVASRLLRVTTVTHTVYADTCELSFYNSLHTKANAVVAIAGASGENTKDTAIFDYTNDNDRKVGILSAGAAMYMSVSDGQAGYLSVCFEFEQLPEGDQYV